MKINKASQASLTADTSDEDETVTYGPVSNRTTVTLSAAGGTEGVYSYTVVGGEANCMIVTSTLTVMSVGDGACTILATREATANYLEVTAEVTLNIEKAPQTGFAALLDGTDGATVTYSSPTLATSTASASNAGGEEALELTEADADCSISGLVVTVLNRGDGECVVTVTSPASANYLEASDTVILSINKASQTITFNSSLADKNYISETIFLDSTTELAGTFTYNTTTTSVCTIDDTLDELDIVGVGTCTFTIDKLGDGNYLAAPQVTRSFTVSQAPQTISWETIESATYGDESFLLAASPSSGLAVSYASTTTSICTVTGETLTIVNAGECTVTANQAGSVNYFAATEVQQTFTVEKAPQTIDFNTLGSKNLGDLPFTLSATSSSGGTVTFAAAPAEICTVAETTVTILAAGECTITASQGGSDNYLAATDLDRPFMIGKASQALSFAEVDSKTFGDPSFTVVATSTRGLQPNYASSLPSICTVTTPGGVVSILKAGTCTISAAQPGNSSTFAALTITTSITIAKATQIITFAELASKELGDAPITLTGTSTSGLEVTFASNSTAVCTVSSSGAIGSRTWTATMLTAGTCSITARQTGNTNNNNAVPVTRTFTVASGAQTITFTDPGPSDFSETSKLLSATASSGLNVSFATLTAPVCTVSDNTVTFVSLGTCTIRATQTGNSNYGAATPVQQSFEITAGVSVIDVADWPDGNWADVAFGDDPFTASAFSTSGATVTFASTTPSVCTTTGTNGTTFTIVGAGTCAFTVSAPAVSGYDAPSDVDLDFSVAKQAQATLVAVATPNHIAIDGVSGTTTMSTTGGNGNGLVTYELVSGANCTISSGTVTATAATTCVVRALKAANTDYASAVSANISIIAAVKPSGPSGSAAAPTGTKGAGQTLTGQATTWTGTSVSLTYQWFICTATSTATTFVKTETVSGCTAASGTNNNANRTYILPTLASISPGTFSNRYWRMRTTATVTISGTSYVAYAWTQTK